jgi:hypothetical protein
MNKKFTEKKWEINLTGISEGIFKPQHGTANEMIAVGRTIKAGFPTSRSDITNATYDAIVEVDGGKKLLRIQIKGTTTGTVSLIGGHRSGKQIDKNAPKRIYKYSEKNCDIFIGINSHNGDCYIIPASHLKKWGGTKALSKLQDYKEKWQHLVDVAKKA